MGPIFIYSDLPAVLGAPKIKPKDVSFFGQVPSRSVLRKDLVRYRGSDLVPSGNSLPTVACAHLVLAGLSYSNVAFLSVKSWRK
jgi:hypothetical protein